MKRYAVTVWLLALLLGVAGVATAQDTADESGYEIMRVLNYAVGVLEPDQWRMAGAEETTNDTHVLWRMREQEDTLFFFVHLYFEGRLNAQRIDNYYDEEAFADILANYQPYEQTAVCRAGDLRLYEFRSKVEGRPWLIRYWVRQAGPQTVLSVHGSTLVEQASVLDDYGARLFPELVSCAAA